MHSVLASAFRPCVAGRQHTACHTTTLCAYRPNNHVLVTWFSPSACSATVRVACRHRVTESHPPYGLDMPSATSLHTPWPLSFLSTSLLQAAHGTMQLHAVHNGTQPIQATTWSVPQQAIVTGAHSTTPHRQQQHVNRLHKPGFQNPKTKQRCTAALQAVQHRLYNADSRQQQLPCVAPVEPLIAVKQPALPAVHMGHLHLSQVPGCKQPAAVCADSQLVQLAHKRQPGVQEGGFAGPGELVAGAGWVHHTCGRQWARQRGGQSGFGIESY